MNFLILLARSRTAMWCFLLAVAFRGLNIAEGSPYTISDERVRSLDITPVLGRGYSISTNSFQSTCLDVQDTTTPSYNYDYTFTDLTRSTDYERDLSGKLSTSFGYFGVKGEINSEAESSSKFKSNTRIVVSTMRIERYYSSLKEERSPLTNDAFELLDRQDYIGFFKSCGPNYVRGIRRAQEVTAIFKFSTSSTELAKDFALGLKVSGWGSSVNSDFASKSKFSSIMSSLEIKILGFGLGLNTGGSDTLVATSLDEYNGVMKYAFKSMTQNEDSYAIGQVYGIELVPWVDNTAFQVASKVNDEIIKIPISRSLTPKAKLIVASTTTPFANTEDTRKLFKCKSPLMVIDKYGYCCEVSSLYNSMTGEYEPEPEEPTPSPVGNKEPAPSPAGSPEPALDPGRKRSEPSPDPLPGSQRTCRLVHKLDKALVKNNMAANGEFVARLDSIVRYRLNQLFTLERCVSSIRAIPEKYNYYNLKAQDAVKYDATIEANFTVIELRMALDPDNKYGLVNHLSQELDEFVDMYYSPCIAALFGSNIGTSPDVEDKYFMAYPWYKHPACNQLSCLAENMRWDRSKKAEEFPGCVPSLIAGVANYGLDNEVAGCTIKEDEEGDEETCEKKTEDLSKFATKSQSCWEGNARFGSVVPSLLMDHFCMPQITDTKANIDTETDLKTYVESCFGEVEEVVEEGAKNLSQEL